MGSFERYKAFQTWKEDFERRLAEHLFFDANGNRRSDNFQEDNSATKITIWIPEKKKTQKVEVLENPKRPGVWIVIVNGIEMGSFVGPLAQMKATRLAGRYLNED